MFDGIIALRIELFLYSRLVNGGEDGIRTHGTVAGTRAFQARRIGHSRTSPHLIG